MKVTADQLRQLYSSLGTEELAQQLLEGGLTDEAKSLLTEELSRRGSKEVNVAFHLAAADQVAQKVEKEVEQVNKRSWIRLVIISAILFTGINIALWLFGKVGAPLLWTSPNDRQCQSQGYWYAGAGQQCEKWWVLPRYIHPS